jgi:hypothetical protein
MVNLLPGDRNEDLDSSRESCAGGIGHSGGRRAGGPCLPWSDGYGGGPAALAIGARRRVTDPQVMRRFLSHAERRIDLAGALGSQPGTFGTFCRLLRPECNHRLRAVNTARKPGSGAAVTADVRTCPSTSASDRPDRNNVTQLTQLRSHEPVVGWSALQRVVVGVVMPGSHAGVHGQVEAPIGLKGEARAVAGVEADAC